MPNTITRPNPVPLPRSPRMGISIDWRTNAQMGAVFGELGVMAVFERFARPVLRAGDLFVMRFPFTPWYRLPQWSDVAVCNMGLYASVAKVCQACKQLGVEPVLYLRRPTDAELEYAASNQGTLSAPFTAAAAEWKGVSVALDEGIGFEHAEGAVRRRQFMGQLSGLQRVMLEPGWDAVFKEDWERPILCATDLYRRKLGDGWAHWRPWSVDGTGPEILVWHHEDLRAPEGVSETAEQERVRVLVSLREGAVLARQKKWSVIFPGDLFVNYGIPREEVW